MPPSPTLSFALKFMIGFAVLSGAFEATRGTALERVVVEDAVLVPTVAVIRVLAPGERIERSDRTIRSPDSQLLVTRGCEGIEIMLLLVAGVLAFPAAWRARVRALAVGGTLAYLLSVGRLVALHFTLRYAPGAWEALHGLVLPLAPIACIGLYFLHWTAGVAPRTRTGPPRHAD